MKDSLDKEERGNQMKEAWGDSCQGEQQVQRSQTREGGWAAQRGIKLDGGDGRR